MRATNPVAFVVRHGRTQLNDPQNPRLRSWENPPLDKRGILDAKMAAQNLKPYSPQIIYSSELTRDFQTAQIISQELGNIAFEVDFDLRTSDMGSLAGEKEEDVAEQVKRWYLEPWWHAPGGGESLNGFLSRFYHAFDIKLNLAIEAEPYRPMVFVSHGRNLAALHARSAMIPQIDALMPFPGGIASISLDERGEPKLDFIGDTEPVQQDT